MSKITFSSKDIDTLNRKVGGQSKRDLSQRKCNRVAVSHSKKVIKQHKKI